METNGNDPQHAAAIQVINTIPILMRIIGAEADERHPRQITLQQMRALLFIRHNPGVNLSGLKAFLDASVSAASKLVDALVRQQLLATEGSAADGRLKLLRITPEGERLTEEMHQRVAAALAQRLTSLSAHECELIALAMRTLCAAIQVPPAPLARP
jgi:DNA-binding MarR family transcriptional regulator